MYKFGKFLLTTTALGAGLIVLSSISLEIKPNQTKANESTNPVSLRPEPEPPNFPPIDYPRLLKMQQLLGGGEKDAYKKYNILCLQAIDVPQIGMTIDQSRNTTWCFPYQRNKTTTKYGESVQEVYLKRNYNGETDSRYSPRQYLYFDNDILTTIQE